MELESSGGGVTYSKAPFPWFGGKSKAAPAVWAALGWRAIEWFKTGFLQGGYGHQQHRERLWPSPHCLMAAEPKNLSLFA